MMGKIYWNTATIINGLMDEIKSPEKPFYFKLSSIEMSCRSVIFVPKTTL